MFNLSYYSTIKYRLKSIISTTYLLDADGGMESLGIHRYSKLMFRNLKYTISALRILFDSYLFNYKKKVMNKRIYGTIVIIEILTFETNITVKLNIYCCYSFALILFKYIPIYMYI